jgi:hypothetical protein
MSETLKILLEHEFIYKFSSNGNEYGFIPTFTKHQRISGEEAKQAPKYPAPPENIMAKQEGSSGEAEEKQEGSSGEEGSCPGKGNGIGERERERERDGDFSFSESLNQNLPDFSKRLERLKAQYNALKIGPPFRKISVNLNPSELSDLMNIAQVYSDDISIKAMENYAKIVNSSEYDPKGCVYHGFISFMVRGVEKYCDEANPFETFKKKTSGPSPPRHWDHGFDISQPQEVI